MEIIDMVLEGWEEIDGVWGTENEPMPLRTVDWIWIVPPKDDERATADVLLLE